MFNIDKKETKKEKKGTGNIVAYLEKSEFKGTGYDYYQEFGTWEGLGAERLGIQGQPILKGEMDRLANCFHPKTNQKIGKKSRNGLEDSFLKTSLSAPKDFSLIYFLDETLGQKELEKDYRESVNATIKFMEQFCLTKINSNNDMKNSGLIIADITHETSRPTKEKDTKSILRPDPQKHEHTLISRLVVDENGKISALSNKLIFQNQIMIGSFFRKELANKLRKRGYNITKRTEYIERDRKGTYVKNSPKIKVNSFAVEGITDEHRKYFSKRNTEIEAMSQKLGANTAIAKNLIANNYKTTKGNYERYDLINEWKDDAKKIGLDNNYLQSLKNRPQADTFLSNFRTDEELLASVVNNGFIYHKDIFSRLYEDEQFTGRKAEDVFQSLVDSKKLSIDSKYKFKCLADLTKVIEKKKKFKNKVSIDKNKAFKILKSNKVSVDDFLNNKFTSEELDDLIVDNKFSNKVEKISEVKINIKAPNVKSIRENSNRVDNNIDSNVDSSASTIESLNGQLSDLNSKLSLAHISEIEKIKIKIKMDAIARQIIELRRKILNKKYKI